MSDEKKAPITVVDLPDGWKSFRIGERELIRVQFPPGPISSADMMAFTDHLLKLARDRQHGAS